MTWFRRLLTFTLLAAILVASLSWALWPRPAITLTLTGLTENLTVRTQSRGSPGDVPELLIVNGLRENEVRLIRGDTLAG